MTEADWLTCTDPQLMLDHLLTSAGSGQRLASDRKLRLFAVACCRQVWRLLTDERSRQVVEVAERYADGEISKIAQATTQAAAWDAARDAARDAAWDAARDAARDAVGDAAEAVAWDAAWNAAWNAARDAQINLLHDIAGNPWRPTGLPWEQVRAGGDLVDLRSPWLTPTVLALVHAAYEERPWRGCERCAYQDGWHIDTCHACHGTGLIEAGNLDQQRLAVLSDALDEAGCQDKVLLAHLRSPGPHVRGCWAVDLLLGKE